MIFQTGSDIITSCPRYDELACPRNDESDQVFENTNWPNGRADDRTVSQADGRALGSGIYGHREKSCLVRKNNRIQLRKSYLVMKAEGPLFRDGVVGQSKA